LPNRPGMAERWRRPTADAMLPGMDTVTSAAENLPSDEAEWLDRVRHADPAATERLVRVYSPRMLAVIRRLVGNDADAHDALQEAFVSAFRAIGDFRGASQLGTWLHRIALNAGLARLRQRHRHDERSIDALLPKFLDDGHQAEPAVDWRPTPPEEVERRETRQLVRQAVDRLPESYRTVLTLRDLEQLDTQETADLLDVSAAVVKTRLHRARLALRTLLDPYFRQGAVL